MTLLSLLPNSSWMRRTVLSGCLILFRLLQQKTTTGLLVNNRNWFLKVLEAGKYEIKVPAVSFWWGPSFWFIASNLSLYPHMVKEVIRASALFMMTPPHDQISFQNIYPSMPSQWALEFQHIYFGRRQTLRPYETSWFSYIRKYELSTAEGI